MADPTFVQGKSGFAAGGVLTYSVTLDAPAGDGHAVILCAGGDKDIGGPFDPDQAGTDVEIDLRSASVSLVIAWYVATGVETVISGDVDANIAGANLFALEIEQDSDPGTWQLVAVGSANSTETNVTSQSTGTTGAAIAAGMGIAAVSCDSVNTAGTPAWTNSYTARYSSANGSTQAGLWVSTHPVAAAATTETTLSRAGGTADQHSGGVIVLGKVAAPDTAGVPFLVDDLGDDATIAVEIAFGADITGDPTAWPWTDVTEDVRADPPITTTLGRGDEASTSQPATLALTLDNSSGAYDLGGEGPHWPFVRQGAPVRITIDPDDAGGGRVVLLAFAAGWVPGWDSTTGGLPVVALTAAGTLRRLQQGQAPVASALRRALAAIESVKAYWPMEDGRDATVLRAVEGGQDMSYTGAPKMAAGGDVFNCSRPIADAGPDGRFTANVTPFPPTGEAQVRFLVRVPDDGLTDGTVLAYVWTTGTLLRWDIVYSAAGSGNLGLYIYNADGTLNSSTPSIGFDMNGKDRRLSLELFQNGTGVDWVLGVIQPSDLSAGVFGASISTRTFLTVSQVQLAPLGACSGVLFGHLTVQDDRTSLYEATGALSAHVGEYASAATASISRTTRLCAENGVALDRFIPTTPGFLHDGDKMGPQLPTTLVALLQECETSDQGQIWDGRHQGLSYTTRRYRENIDGGAALTIDAGGGQLAQPWSPTHDDQRIRNDVTVTRLQGVSARVVDEDGARGTAAVGAYSSAITVNTRLDSMAEQHAAWQVALGTQTGYRVPSVSVDLRATPALAGAVLDVIPGDRLDVEDLDDTFAGWGASVGLVQLIVEGIAHVIGPRTWVVTFACSPFSPWGVAEFAAETGDVDPLVWRLDTDGSTLAVARSIGATSLSVATAAGPLWTTTSDDYPLYVSVGGIRVRATACSGTSSPQTMTVDALPVARAVDSPIVLWDPRPLGL